ncbi:MAG: RidA family protein [Gammaproteobacteria bacterium]|nr:RidA family protein [Gammaproteobacteria bacterium]MBI5617933.1 RidA family protein [Gammaproteobacteria bacterium]
MNTPLVPPSIAAPNNEAYSHAVLVPAGSRLLHIAGQIGTRLDGTIPERFDEQADIVWTNLFAILAAAGMEPASLVKVNAFIVGPEHIPAYVAARRRHLGELKPASTALCVPRLVRPQWLIEIDAVAAAP